MTNKKSGSIVVIAVSYEIRNKKLFKLRVVYSSNILFHWAFLSIYISLSIYLSIYLSMEFI